MVGRGPLLYTPRPRPFHRVPLSGLWRVATYSPLCPDSLLPRLGPYALAGRILANPYGHPSACRCCRCRSSDASGRWSSAWPAWTLAVGWATGRSSAHGRGASASHAATIPKRDHTASHRGCATAGRGLGPGRRSPGGRAGVRPAAGTASRPPAADRCRWSAKRRDLLVVDSLASPNALLPARAGADDGGGSGVLRVRHDRPVGRSGVE